MILIAALGVVGECFVILFLINLFDSYIYMLPFIAFLGGLLYFLLRFIRKKLLVFDDYLLYTPVFCPEMRIELKDIKSAQYDARQISIYPTNQKSFSFEMVSKNADLLIAWLKRKHISLSIK